MTAKPYREEVVIDEKRKEIERAECRDCAAAAGCCKHAVALLGWLERRSAEKSVTSTESYWRKARLSDVPSELKSHGIDRLAKRPRVCRAECERPVNFLAQVLAGAPHGASGLIFQYERETDADLKAISMDRMLREFIRDGGGDCGAFVSYCAAKMGEELCERVQMATKAQSECALWHSMRFGRVTASKVYAVAHCVSAVKPLVMAVIGASKLRDTAAMERGRRLEPAVLMKVGRVRKIRIKRCGIVLSQRCPMLGASPDGMTPDGKTVVEVKCPTTEDSRRRYLRTDGNVAAKHVAQLQVLMALTGAEAALFCVADPRFEDSGKVDICTVPYDKVAAEQLISACATFWSQHVFTELYASYR